MASIQDLPQLLADTDARARRHELRALNAVGPAHWDERQRWLDRAAMLRDVAQRLQASQGGIPTADGGGSGSDESSGRRSR